MKIINFTKNISTVFISLILCISLLEFFSWIWIDFFRKNNLTQWEFRAKKPQPYVDAKYFNEDFLIESKNSVRGELRDTLKLNDFNGKYINVKNGFRVTLYKPEVYDATIHIFGGSTIFSQEVPDEYTIPSILQKLLVEKNYKFLVKNYGLHGMNVYQQKLVMDRVTINRNDIVVFYNGVNDIYYYIFVGSKSGWVDGVPAIKPILVLDGYKKYLYEWHNKLKKISYSADLALDIVGKTPPHTIKDINILNENLIYAAKMYKESLVLAHKKVSSKSANFIHFLQPQIFERNNLSEYEKGLIKNTSLTAPGVENAFKIGYPKLRYVSKSLQNDGIEFKDLSKILNNLKVKNSLMLDFCHINHVGNKIIADEILHTLIERKFIK